jgi:hypothetical protein
VNACISTSVKESVMKRILTVVLFVLFSTGVVFSQSKKEQEISPVILQVSAPIYPIPAIHLGLEESIRAEVKIDTEGKIISINFDRGAKVFRIVVEDALKNFKFEKSLEKERHININFIFTLLPYDSNSYVSSVYRSQNTIEIFAKRVKVLDSTDNLCGSLTSFQLYDGL